METWRKLYRAIYETQEHYGFTEYSESRVYSTHRRLTTFGECLIGLFWMVVVLSPYVVLRLMW